MTSESRFPGAPLPSPLDGTVIDQLRKLRNGEELIGTLVRTFIVTSAADFAIARRSVEESRWSEVEAAAHRLAGSSAALGAVEVTAACRAIQERVRAERTAEVGPLVTRLARELERARTALEASASRD